MLDLSLKLHPYEVEIMSMMENPPALSYFIKSEKCPDMDTCYIWVDTQHQLEYLAELLSKEEVFAVDTEQHSIRSFLGFTALMQVYICITICLRHSAMHVKFKS